MATCALDEEIRHMLDEALNYIWQAGGYPDKPSLPPPDPRERDYEVLAQVCSAIGCLRGVAARLRTQLLDPAE